MTLTKKLDDAHATAKLDTESQDQGEEAELVIELDKLSDDELVSLLSEQAVASVKAYHNGKLLVYQHSFDIARMAWGELERRRWRAGAGEE